ncbi:MAG: prolyl oligopeptidase family serine peptidase [Bacteroidales bacterium]|nr:prolyl oligopeptidase family serine peptidase [Bacteroidales bacterium]
MKTTLVTKYLKPVSLLIFMLFCVGINEISSQPSLFSYNQFTDKQGNTLNYRLLYPDYNPGRVLPLVVFLHGSGERGNDNEAQLKWGVREFANEQMMMQYPAIVVAPQCPEKLSWSNVEEDTINMTLTLKPEPSQPMKMVIELIHQLITDLPIDTGRIYITGLSMGGHGTYDVLQRYPDLFAAAVPVCGAGDTSSAASIAHIPIWIFHGAEDKSVDPKYSMDMLVALTKAGAHPGFTQYPEVGHFSWLGAYTDPLMIEWLFRQRK